MGKDVFTNNSGSNMTRGLLASIVRDANWRGNLRHDVAILEIDEAYAAKLAPVLKPKAVVLTNVLRDQLDRFGEIDHTAQLLGGLARHATKLVVYNAHDGRLQKLHNSQSDARYIRVGMSSDVSMHFPDDDALYGLPQTSGKEEPKADYKLIGVVDDEAQIEGKLPINFPVQNIPGWHNTFNMTLAYASVCELYGRQNQQIFDAIRPPYGRGEEICVGEKSFVLQLVKNPGGFRIAMDVLPDRPALIIVNDLIADGRDVSWLWDVDVEPLRRRPSIAAGGIRAHDMANRLKYAEQNVNFAETDEAAAIKKFVDMHQSGVLFLTYTAMLHSRKILKGLSS